MKIVIAFLALTFSSIALAQTPDEWAIEYTNGTRVSIVQDNSIPVRGPETKLDQIAGNTQNATPVPRVSEDAVLQRVSSVVQDIERYHLGEEGLSYWDADTLRSKDPTADSNVSLITQTFGDISYEALEVRHLDNGGYVIEGVLLDPVAPELQAENWLSESEARDMAIGVLKQFGPTDSLIGDRLSVQYHWEEEGQLTITPIYHAVTADGRATVNLYTGEVYSREESILVD